MQTSKTLELTIQGIGDTLEELVELHKESTNSKTDSINMKILTDCLDNLKFFNKEFFK